MMKKARQIFTVKVGGANSKVNGAYAQSRPSGILFAPANGKLYFEFLKIFSVPENHLRLQRAKRFRSQRFF